MVDEVCINWLGVMVIVDSVVLIVNIVRIGVDVFGILEVVNGGLLIIG